VIATNTNIKISDRDLIDEAKLAGKIPELTRGIIRRKIIQAQIAKRAQTTTPRNFRSNICCKTTPTNQASHHCCGSSPHSGRRNHQT
jgi:hypothetical protein